MKRNDAEKFPKMFEAEAAGLRLLNETVHGIAPEVMVIASHHGEQWLLLENIPKAAVQKDFWENFAKQLAAIHRRSHEFFGLEHPNYIGSLPQSNTRHREWNSFFILERIEPQLKMAIDAAALPASAHRLFEKFFLRLQEIFPEEKPSLLHGDLWSGNYMTGANGYVKLIDPAVNFSFREMDLAMSRLFGGFHPSFYEFYHENFPLENGFEKRVDYCNLYPLLVHVNLFGGHYAGSVLAIIQRFR